MNLRFDCGNMALPPPPQWHRRCCWLWNYPTQKMDHTRKLQVWEGIRRNSTSEEWKRSEFPLEWFAYSIQEKRHWAQSKQKIPHQREGCNLINQECCWHIQWSNRCSGDNKELSSWWDNWNANRFQCLRQLKGQLQSKNLRQHSNRECWRHSEREGELPSDNLRECHCGERQFISFQNINKEFFFQFLQIFQRLQLFQRSVDIPTQGIIR